MIIRLIRKNLQDHIKLFTDSRKELDENLEPFMLIELSHDVEGYKSRDSGLQEKPVGDVLDFSVKNPATYFSPKKSRFPLSSEFTMAYKI